LFFIPLKTQLCCVQKKGQKTTQRSCKKRAKKYTYAKGVKRKGAKKIQVASPHHLFYSSRFTFLVFPEVSGQTILSVFSR